MEDNNNFIDPLGELFSDVSEAMNWARVGCIDTGYSYIIRAAEMVNENDSITKYRYRKVLCAFEKRWSIKKQ